MRGEGSGVGWVGAREVGTGGCGGIGPVVCSFGVEVVRRAGAVRCGDGGEWRWRLGEGLIGCVEDAVVVDGGYVGVGGGLRLRQQDARCEQQRGGLGAEDAASGGHGDGLWAEEYHDGQSCVSTTR